MTGWMVQTFVATTLLMLLVLGIRGLVARAFGARAAYALWALPALRLAMPSLPGWHVLYVPVFFLGGHHKVVGLTDPLNAARLVAEHSAPPPPLPPLPLDAPLVHGPGLPWGGLLVALWLGGAAVWFGWQMLRYQLFLNGAMRSAKLLTNECGVDVLLTEHVDGPVAAGVIHRRIFLPADFMQRYAPAERRLALLHEGAHHDRGDILANLVALVVLALHWWNPLAHRAYRLFRADQELACDATVLADVGAEERHAYGSAVLKSVSARMPGVACALSHKAELKRRLQTMAQRPIGSTRLWLGGAVAVAAIGAGLLVTASGEATVPPPAEIAQIKADAEQARQEGQRAAIEGRRAADEGRREAAEARREAAEARREGEAARAEGLRAARHASDDAGRDQALAQAEAVREMAAARREQALDAAEHARDIAQAEREHALDRAEAQRERALEAAQRARDHAQAMREAALAAADREQR